MSYTTANLVSAVERRSFMPNNTSTFSTDEILAIATEEMRSVVIPEILSIREEYMVYTKDLTITASQAGYDIPERAFGNVIREVRLLSGSNLDNLPRISIEDVDSTTSGIPNSFYLKNNQIILYPTPGTTTGSLRVDYYLTPGTLVQTTAAAVISAIDTGTNVVTVTDIPTTWATGDIYDFVAKDGGQEYRDVDYTSTLVSGSDITFSSLPSDLAVGDYVAVQGESPLVQCIFTMREVHAQFTAAAVLKYAGQPGASEAFDLAQMMLEKSVRALTPRVRGEDQYITQGWF